MRLTILGKSPSWSDAGGACSGYLVEHEDDRFVLDCGSGVLGTLRETLDYADVGHVVLSHVHADHILDLVPFGQALTYSPRGPLPPVVIHAPPGGEAELAAIFGALGFPALLESAFEVREYAVDGELEVGELRLTFAPMDHFVPANAVSVQEPGGARFVFSADTGPTPALVELAAGADLLLCEATLIEPAFGHLTARQAGEHASAAGVGRLVLTHFSDELDPDDHRASAAEAFAGPVALAAPGNSYDIPS